MPMYGGNDTSGSTAWTESFYQNLLAGRNRQNVDYAFSGFTPEWYDQRAKAYEQSALPQLSDQYQAERKSLTYALANRGLSKSSAANEQFTNLGNEMTRQQQNITNAGQSYANQLKQNIASSKANLYGMSGLPTKSATNMALQSAASFSAPNPAAPIADYMSGFNNQLFSRLALSQFGQPSYSGQTSANPGSMTNVPSNWTATGQSPAAYVTQ